MTNWTDHDGSDECPIGREVRCYVRTRSSGGIAMFGPATAGGWDWTDVRQYRLADDSALLDAPPETHAGEEDSYEPGSADLTELRWQAALAALPALIARHREDVSWTAVAPTAFSIADACLAERAKGGPSNG